ncbi:hypothetical protein ACRRTK_016497 [Alexandromys fortis]
MTRFLKLPDPSRFAALPASGSAPGQSRCSSLPAPNRHSQESPLRPPDPEQPHAAIRRPSAPEPCVSSQTLGARGKARYSPLRTGRGRAAGNLYSGPGRARCARTPRSPRGRGRRGVSHPAPPPATSLVTSEAQSTNGRGALERNARCAA